MASRIKSAKGLDTSKWPVISRTQLNESNSYRVLETAEFRYLGITHIGYTIGRTSQDMLVVSQSAQRQGARFFSARESLRFFELKHISDYNRFKSPLTK